MKNLEQKLIELAIEDFTAYLFKRSNDIDLIAIEYTEAPTFAFEEGYSIKVIRNNITANLFFEAVVTVIYNDGEKQEINMDSHVLEIPVGYKTPKGYFSRKKVDVNFDYKNNEPLTLEQVFELMNFKTDAKKNMFDPFFHENEAKRRNASGWNYVAQNYITDPYCTR